MKTKISTQDSLAELRDFVTHQAAEDAVLKPTERLYQAKVVTDVLKHEHLKPKLIKELVSDYSAGVVRHLKVA